MSMPVGTILAVDGLPELSDGQPDPWSVVKVIGHFLGAEEIGPEEVVQCFDAFVNLPEDAEIDTAPKAVSPVVLAELGYVKISHEEAVERLAMPA